jgi:hypothetical protein
MIKENMGGKKNFLRRCYGKKEKPLGVYPLGMRGTAAGSSAFVF